VDMEIEIMDIEDGMVDMEGEGMEEGEMIEAAGEGWICLSLLLTKLITRGSSKIVVEEAEVEEEVEVVVSVVETETVIRGRAEKRTLLGKDESQGWTYSLITNSTTGICQ